MSKELGYIDGDCSKYFVLARLVFTPQINAVPKPGLYLETSKKTRQEEIDLFAGKGLLRV